MICFHKNTHKSGVNRIVAYKCTRRIFEICWDGDITEQLLRSYNEMNRATDFAACAIALIIVRGLTEFTSIEQACIGTTIDYYLVKQNQGDDLIFNMQLV
jgi:hypothetical protein